MHGYEGESTYSVFFISQKMSGLGQALYIDLDWFISYLMCSILYWYVQNPLVFAVLYNIKY